MLLPLTTIRWDCETGTYVQEVTGVNPMAVAHVEAAGDLDGKTTITVYVDRQDKPLRIEGTVMGMCELINEACGLELCEPDSCEKA